MTDKDLQEFFKTKSDKSKGSKIDWDKKKAEWIKSIGDLYSQIEDWLGTSNKPNVKITYEDKLITENYLGNYKVQEMLLQVDDEIVKFSPKGRNIIGAAGRIDLIGDLGSITIVLQPESRWGIVVSRIPTLKIKPFDPSSFLDALKEIMSCQE